MDLYDRMFVGVAAGGWHVRFNAFIFGIECRERWQDLIPGIMFAVLMLAQVPGGQFEKRDQVGIIHSKNRPVVRNLRIHHHVRQPFGRGNDFLVLIPFLPWLEIKRLFFTNLQKRVPGERIHRLQTAVKYDRQLAKFIEGKALVLGRLHLQFKPQGHHEHEEWRKPFLEKFFHFWVLLLAMRPTR